MNTNYCRSRRSVKLLIDVGIAQDCLDVLSRFGEWDRLDEFLRIAILALSQPLLDAIRSRVVGRERVFKRAEFIDHAFEVARPQLQIDGRSIQLAGVVAF